MEKEKKDLIEVPKSIRVENERVELVAPELLFKDYDFEPEEYFNQVEELNLPSLEELMGNRPDSQMNGMTLKPLEEILKKKRPEKKEMPVSKKIENKKKR